MIGKTMMAVQEIERAMSVMATHVEHALSGIRIADPLERYMGENGELWQPLSLDGSSHLGEQATPYNTIEGLTSCRKVGKYLATENPFAICAHENRVSYVVGFGHSYGVESSTGDTLDPEVKSRAMAIVEAFIKLNGWPSRQVENLYRRDRDGEVFLRKFYPEGGILSLRYVEPWAVAPPKGKETATEWSYGIRTEDDDAETVLEYCINGEPVDAAEIQHRKRGVTTESKRGVPLLWAVRHNLTRALKILRNGSSVTEIQTAIGMIRRLANATRATVKAWSNSNATGSTVDESGRTQLQETFKPGSVITTNGQTEYEFPGMAIDPAKYVESLQAELRTVGARLNMPEYMISSKSDDSTRAAAFVAEGPAHKKFERLQWEEIEPDLDLFEEALDFATESKLLTPGERAQVRVTAQPPALISRDTLQESQRRQSDLAAGFRSPQTATLEAGYDYDTEQSNIEQHNDRGGEPPRGLPDLRGE